MNKILLTLLFVQSMAWASAAIDIDHEKQEDVMGCGYVSVFYDPPISTHRHPIMINEIKDIGFRGHFSYSKQEQVFKLPVGEVEIVAQELIRPDAIERYRGDLRSRRHNSIKAITMLIEPDTVYHLAAEYLADRRDREHRDEYWRPVVWKVTERSCE